MQSPLTLDFFVLKMTWHQTGRLRPASGSTCRLQRYPVPVLVSGKYLATEGMPALQRTLAAESSSGGGREWVLQGLERECVLYSALVFAGRDIEELGTALGFFGHLGYASWLGFLFCLCFVPRLQIQAPILCLEMWLSSLWVPFTSRARPLSSHTNSLFLPASVPSAHPLTHTEHPFPHRFSGLIFAQSLAVSPLCPS